MIQPDYQHLALQLISTAQAAGAAIMDIHRQDFSVDIKSDDSPVTAADRNAEAIILKDLAVLAPDIPVVAEEAANEGHIPTTGALFFLVDPLDGTKEFVRKSHEFTVNIALIENGQPVFGLVYAPALERLFFTPTPNQAVTAKLSPDGPPVVPESLKLEQIVTSPPAADGLLAVASKSHMSEATRTYLQNFTIKELKSAGSSLKFCLLAAAEADLYPRFGPTMEWDTAAGDAVLRAAGGQVLQEDGTPLVYGKSQNNYLNPNFIAWAHEPLEAKTAKASG